LSQRQARRGIYVNPYESITRRQLLRRAAAGGAVLSLPSLLAACGGGGIEGDAGQGTTEETTTQVKRELADELVFANWPFYIDLSDDEKRRPSLEQFTKDTGVKVRYIEEVNSNEEWFGKYQAQLKAGDDINRDIVVLTDWMAARMVTLGYVEKKDKSAIPNEKNLQDTLTSPGFDPNRDYSLPWQSGLTGIAFNRKLTGGPVTSIEQLLTDPKLKGRVLLLDDIASCMTCILLSNGDDPENVTAEAFERGIQTIQDSVDSGHLRGIVGNQYVEDLVAENVWAAMAWSGDVVGSIQPDNPDVEFVIPDTGGEIFTDNMLIPLHGDVFTASTFMNYVYDPKVAAQIETGVQYICPVKGAQEAIKAIDPKLAENELIFPTEETLAQVKIFDSEAAANPDFREQFQTVVGA
jgi:spermidine/putrescine transport system substrate-binding protein